MTITLPEVTKRQIATYPLPLSCIVLLLILSVVCVGCLWRVPGTVIQDRLISGGWGPVLVVVPKGAFAMGQDENVDEQPVHRVTINRDFAMGKYEVTLAEFRRFIMASKYRTDAEAVWSDSAGCNARVDNNWGWQADYNWAHIGYGQADDEPVACISWHDANAYVNWLSGQTGERYRLPSEAEWEYAARGGSDGNYFWGDKVGQGNANCRSCGTAWDNTRASPVGSFRANDFGLFDMHGNLWEWVTDCYQAGYQGAPLDGSPRRVCDTQKKVLRSGSWLNSPAKLRSATRYAVSAKGRAFNSGFRVVREL